MLKRSFIMLSIFISLLISSIVVVAPYINLNDKKVEISKFLQEKYSLFVNINGDIVIDFSPAPCLLIYDIVVEYAGEDLLRIDKTRLKLPIISMLINKNIKENLDSVMIEGVSLSIDNLLTYFKYEKVDLSKLGLTNFSAKNLTISDYEDDLYFLNDVILPLIDIEIQDNNLTIDGNISYKNTIYNKFYIILNNLNQNNANFNCNIEGQGLFFKASGDLDGQSYKSGKGEMQLAIYDFSKIEEYFNDSINHNNELSTTKKNNKPLLDISADIILDNNDLLKIFNFQSKASGISDLVSNIIIDISTPESFKVNFLLNTQSINLDNFLDFTSIEPSLRKEIIYSFFSYCYSNFNMQMPYSVVGNFQLYIDNIHIFGENIEKLDIKFNLFQGRFVLNKFQANLPGQSTINLQGITTSNSIRAEFKGKSKILIADFPKFATWSGITASLEETRGIKVVSFNSDLFIIPNRIKFLNSSLLINESLINAKISFIKDGYGKISSYIMCRAEKINLDRIGVDTIFDDIAYLLYSADFDKSGDTYYKLVQNYNWLRNLKSTWRIDFVANQLLFKGDSYKDVNFIADIANDNITVINLGFNAANIDISSNFKLTLPAFRAFIEANININRMDIANIDTLYNNYISGMKDRLLKVTPKSSNISTMINNINFFSASNYDANIILNIKNTTLNNKEFFANLTSKVSFLGGVASLKSKLFAMNGQITLAGNAVIMGLVPQINGTFVFDNINPNRLLYYATGSNNINGYMSISGAISTYGSNKYNLLRNMDGSIVFAGKRIYWDGIGLDNIIQAVDSSYTTNDKIKQINYYIQNGKSIFDDMQGSIKIKSGIATSLDIKLNNNRLSSIFAANYDIPSYTISSNGIVSFIPMGYNNPISMQIKTLGQLPYQNTEVNTQQILDFITPNPALIPNTSDNINNKNQNDETSIRNKF